MISEDCHDCRFRLDYGTNFNPRCARYPVIRVGDSWDLPTAFQKCGEFSQEHPGNLPTVGEFYRTLFEWQKNHPPDDWTIAVSKENEPQGDQQ